MQVCSTKVIALSQQLIQPVEGGRVAYHAAQRHTAIAISVTARMNCDPPRNASVTVTNGARFTNVGDQRLSFVPVDVTFSVPGHQRTNFLLQSSQAFFDLDVGPRRDRVVARF